MSDLADGDFSQDVPDAKRSDENGLNEQVQALEEIVLRFNVAAARPGGTITRAA